MAARFSPAGHPLLSAAAAALEASVLDTHAEAVERELGVHELQFTGEDIKTATLAVVYGVNCRLKNDGGRQIVSKGKGAQSVAYAENDTDSWCYLARKLASEIIGWNLMRSVR